jgi:hypothetical protein
MPYPIKYNGNVQVGYSFAGDLVPPLNKAEGFEFPPHYYEAKRYVKPPAGL